MMRIQYMIIVLCLATPTVSHTAPDPHAGHQHHLHNSQKAWSDRPMLVKPPGRGSRTSKNFMPVNLEASQLQVYPSVNSMEEKASWETKIKDGKAVVASRGGKQGGYHWLVAREDGNNQTRIASTVVYFSNPGPAPRAMLKQDKAELEIRPVRLPREHQQYRADETWPFQLRYQGKPVAATKVVFTSRNGSRQEYFTDESGIVDVRFPDDFPALDPGKEGHQGHGHGRRKSEFVLAAQLRYEGHDLLSAFNYHYTPGAYENKNLTLGIGMAMLGMFIASPLLVHRKPKARGGRS